MQQHNRKFWKETETNLISKVCTLRQRPHPKSLNWRRHPQIQAWFSSSLFRWHRHSWLKIIHRRKNRSSMTSLTFAALWDTLVSSNLIQRQLAANPPQCREEAPRHPYSPLTEHQALARHPNKKIRDLHQLTWATLWDLHNRSNQACHMSQWAREVVVRTAADSRHSLPHLAVGKRIHRLQPCWDECAILEPLQK